MSLAKNSTPQQTRRLLSSGSLHLLTVFAILFSNSIIFGLICKFTRTANVFACLPFTKLTLKCCGSLFSCYCCNVLSAQDNARLS